MPDLPDYYADQPELVEAVIEARRVQMESGDTDAAIRDLVARYESMSVNSATRALEDKTFRHPSLYPDGHPGIAVAEAHLKERDEEQKRRQRMRYVSAKKRVEVLERDKHECVYCGADLCVVPLAIDHIVPVSAGGTNDVSNLQATCRTCNARKKNFRNSDGEIREYLDRRREQDAHLETVAAVLNPIISNLIWVDMEEAACPWCGLVSGKAGEIDEFPCRSSVWRCKPCRRYFGVAGINGLGEFIGEIRSVIFGSWYVEEEVVEIVNLILSEGSQEQVVEKVLEYVGDLMEVKKKRHRHRGDEGCWCEFGLSEFFFTGSPIKQIVDGLTTDGG